uniref:Periplasmic nitrate reductase n=1 Tax=Lygus hesperus TaxID=30085 RepID=A0A0A9YAD7_LYGHE
MEGQIPGEEECEEIVTAGAAELLGQPSCVQTDAEVQHVELTANDTRELHRVIYSIFDSFTHLSNPVDLFQLHTPLRGRKLRRGDAVKVLNNRKTRVRCQTQRSNQQRTQRRQRQCL